jgi:hypothetical protein
MPGTERLKISVSPSLISTLHDHEEESRATNQDDLVGRRAVQTAYQDCNDALTVIEAIASNATLLRKHTTVVDLHGFPSLFPILVALTHHLIPFIGKALLFLPTL